jgi:two-component system aerobic respiration control sensor histidine kinase ArcB
MPSVDSSKSASVLDIPMLEQYIELVGPKLINDGLAVFERMMPGYLAVLESNLTARDQKGIVDEGIRLKALRAQSVCAISSSWAADSNAGFTGVVG